MDDQAHYELSEKERNVALRVLSARLMSCAELRAKLMTKGLSDARAELAVIWARERRYVDDAEVAAALVRRALREGRGGRWLEAQGRKRLLSDALIREAQGALASDDEPQVARATALLERRFPDLDPTGRALRRRAENFLLRRGYDFDIIRRAFERQRRAGASPIGGQG